MSFFHKKNVTKFMGLISDTATAASCHSSPQPKAHVNFCLQA